MMRNLCQNVLIKIRNVSTLHQTKFHTTNADHVRVRFAPSPTGHLHLGGLRTALCNHLFTRSHQGTFILRIEDTDQARVVPGAVEKLTRMLEWSGIQIDEGPHHGGSHGPYVQSHRLPLYTSHIEQVLKTKYAYRCFCTPKRLELLRKDAARRRETFRYDNRCRFLSVDQIDENLKQEKPYVVRLKMESSGEPWHDEIFGETSYNVADIEGDPILMKSDGYPTYHFANVIDDHLMEITHVFRGVEWLVSTPKHILLYKAFGWTAPLYGHLPLLLNSDGTKLSKRQNDIHVEHMMNRGYLPEAILHFLASMGSGFNTHHVLGSSLDEMSKAFDIGLMKPSSSHVDMQKLLHYNQQCQKLYLDDKQKTNQLVKQLHALIKSKYETQVKENPTLVSKEYLERILQWSKDRVSVLDELLGDDFSYLWFMPSTDSLTQANFQPHQLEVIASTLAVLEETDDEVYASVTAIKSRITAVMKQYNMTLPQYMKLIRMTLSGRQTGPPVAEMLSTLGKSSALQRLQKTIDFKTE